MAGIVDVLRDRCLLEEVSSPDLATRLEKPATIYAGFDPTSDSLQAGNFVTIMALANFQRGGHRVIAVVGGATGMIGDPSGKTSERSLLSADDLVRNQEGIRENLARFLDFEHPTSPASIVNNADWLQSYAFIDFLRDVGKHFRMGTMLGKESVRARLASDSGMSFTEFSYQLLQAYDFLHLYDACGCELQIGGSDQWGNITAGIDLVHKVRGAEVFGLTIPLVCDSSGKKFGKSEGNAIYLDHRKTSYYDFYQFFIRTTDSDVIRFLKIFTFLSLEAIAALEEQLAAEPEKRAAQKRLAEEVTRTVHGVRGLELAQRASDVLFGASMEGLNADDLLQVFANVPSTTLTRDEVLDQPAINVAAATGVCASRGAARRLVQNKGFYVNNQRVEEVDQVIGTAQIIDDRLVVLRSGKRNFHLVKLA